MHWLPRQTQIGIEMTATEVRATAVTKTATGFCVLTSVILPINTTAGETLKQLRQQLNYRREKTIFAINHREVMDKTIPLSAALTDQDVLTYIHQQRLKLFGLATTDDLAIDCRCLPPQVATDTWQVIAAKNSAIKEKILLAQAANFNLYAIDVDLLALTRLPAFLTPSSTQPYIAIVLIDAFYLQFCVMQQHHLIYTQQMPLPDEKDLCYTQTVATSINQSHQLFQRATGLPAIDNIYVADAALMHLLMQRVTLVTPINGRSLTSLALALWGLV
jgi:Tfp pilus assembly PilM family ATPase